jgi:hypothetical protein
MRVTDPLTVRAVVALLGGPVGAGRAQAGTASTLRPRAA